MKARSVLPCLVAVATTVAGCGQDPEAAGTPTSPTSPTITVPAPAPTPAPSVPATTTAPAGLGCLPVSARMLNAIGAGAKRSAPLKMGRGAAVPVTRRTDAFYVAAWFTPRGLGEQYALWVIVGSQGPDTRGQVLSADHVARMFTIWPDARRVANAINVNEDPAASAAALCILQPSSGQ